MVVCGTNFHLASGNVLPPELTLIGATKNCLIPRLLWHSWLIHAHLQGFQAFHTGTFVEKTIRDQEVSINTEVNSDHEYHD